MQRCCPLHDHPHNVAYVKPARTHMLMCAHALLYHHIYHTLIELVRLFTLSLTFLSPLPRCVFTMAVLYSDIL